MAPAGSRPRAGDALGVLRRNPAFARVYAAQLISFGGDWFSVVALQVLVLDLTGSATLAGLLLAMQILPTAVVAPFAGVLVDRLDRRAVMIAADVSRALLALGLLFARSEETLWVAFVCQGTIAAITAFFEPASSAALPNLVRAQDLPAANVLVGSAWGTMLAVGAGLGGIVAGTLGREAAFIGDALSFAVSAALLLSVRERFQERRDPRETHVTILEDIREMIRFARAERRVAALLLVKGGFGLSAGTIALISIMATEVFDAGETGTGVLMSARGAGALAGPFLFRALFGTSDRALFRSIASAFVVFAAGYTIFGVAPALWIAAVGTCIAHVGGGAQWTMSTLGLQRFSPDRIRGRVFAADYTLVSLTIGLSMWLAAALADRFGPRPVALGMSVAGALYAVVWSASTRRSWPSRVARRPGG